MSKLGRRGFFRMALGALGIAKSMSIPALLIAPIEKKVIQQFVVVKCTWVATGAYVVTDSSEAVFNYVVTAIPVDGESCMAEAETSSGANVVSMNWNVKA